MKYVCKIVDIIDGDTVEVNIQGVILTGLVSCGITKEIGETAEVELEFFPDIVISECKEKAVFIRKTNEYFGYIIAGILDVDKAQLHSLIDFEIPREYLFDYGYLHGKYVMIEIIRMDFIFERL